MAAVREALGPDVRLMVDALYNYDVAEALRFAYAVARYDITFLEAPVSPFDVEGQAEVHGKSPIPVCGNETLAWTAPFRDLITRRATHWVQFDLGACGGIQEGRRIAELAHAFHLPATLHAASSAVLLAASLHLAASIPNAHSVEYHMLHQWLWDLVARRQFSKHGWHAATASRPRSRRDPRSGQPRWLSFSAILDHSAEPARATTC